VLLSKLRRRIRVSPENHDGEQVTSFESVGVLNVEIIIILAALMR